MKNITTDLTPCEALTIEELANELHDHGITSPDADMMDLMTAAAARLRSVAPALRKALAFIEEEQASREDAGHSGTRYADDARAAADAVRDALGAWEE